MATTRKATASAARPVVLILGTVNVRKIMRQRPELFTGATVERNVRQPFLGSREDYDALLPADMPAKMRDAKWRAHCSAAFKAAADAADTHADSVTLASAGKPLIVIASVDVFEHDPKSGLYCQIPGITRGKDGDATGGAYLDMVEIADEVIYV